MCLYWRNAFGPKALVLRDPLTLRDQAALKSWTSMAAGMWNALPVFMLMQEWLWACTYTHLLC